MSEISIFRKDVIVRWYFIFVHRLESLFSAQVKEDPSLFPDLVDLKSVRSARSGKGARGSASLPMFVLTPSENGFFLTSNCFPNFCLPFRKSFSEKFDNFRYEISGNLRIEDILIFSVKIVEVPKNVHQNKLANFGQP